jgi:hypothetical protein
MITQKEAERIGAKVLGRQPDDKQEPWELREFIEGWLVVELGSSLMSVRGAATDVIERETGHLVRFPSSVSPAWIMEEYPVVREYGNQVQD